jgi:hypothetical protein
MSDDKLVNALIAAVMSNARASGVGVTLHVTNAEAAVRSILQSERASMEGEIERLREALNRIANGRVARAVHNYSCLCSRCAAPPGALRSIAEAALTSSKTGDE